MILDKSLGYLPLHHELDSGLGWTDGRIHQGELSGLDTEEGGLDEGLRGGAPGPQGGGSSESFISSELSDSGFYSVSTGEFRRFQRMLETRMRLYSARLHAPEPCDRRERRDSCQKNHRELLEAIPETLTVQPQHQPQHQHQHQHQHQLQCAPLGMGGLTAPPPRGLFR